jgi:4-diphosphocytidyl-2-C-methyl-D-erythritol kinase
VAVFKALGLQPGSDIAADHPADRALPTSRADLIAALQHLRNDLEPPARAMAPEIDVALAALAATGAPLVRMSGSGATVFALYHTPGQALAAAAATRRAHPGWWVRATLLR